MATVPVLVLTEDSGKQAIPTIQTLIRAALRLVDPCHDSQRVTLKPLPSNERAVNACRANNWKDRCSSDRPRLLGHIAGQLLQGTSVVVFHVDSDTSWSKRSTSENRQKFNKIIREGVKAVLCGAAPNPFSPPSRAPSKYLDAQQATAVLERLVVMHPCYSIESWLFQAVDEVLAHCRVSHADAEHQLQIDSWRADRTLLDEVLRPKDAFDCVRDRHNEELAARFPAAEVLGARRSWSEFVEAIARTKLLAPPGGEAGLGAACVP